MKRTVFLAWVVFYSLVGSSGAAAAQGLSPREAVQRMTVPPGFEVKLAASEPDIRQPVTMSFDDRGRLWVIQYLQYPRPAGLKPVKVDQYLRTTYDHLPEPPPRGPRGADQITILEDTHGDGSFHKVRDFVTGLNLASGMALGYGGVFVAQPPYLLFYPDRDGNDIPDGDPEVLLTGFGMEDAHAFPNSLQWGPDGWLYGAQGSTVTSHIRGITFQQGIWRYHPRTRKFELFAEGGGNTWGLDFDSHGNVIAGTNDGSSAMLHQVQGAYYVKNFGKHGELHNPYAYGYFEHVPYSGFRGGHVTCGGIIYQGGSFPRSFDNVYIAANPLSNALYWHVLTPHGSSFTARFGGEFLLGHDTWFRPIDCLVGPDGSLFVADWCDKRINHVDPVDNWDRSNGRIYKIEAAGTRPARGLDLSHLPSHDLIGLLASPNDWYVREALRLLGERRDPAVMPALCHRLLERRDDRLALVSLWALYVSGGLDNGLAADLLGHPSADVRCWTVRLLGDAGKLAADLRTRLAALARTEPSCIVRSQLACSCKRLPAEDALPILRALLQHQEDRTDPNIPLLLWWAVEAHAVSARHQILNLFDTADAWHNPIMHDNIAARLARRWIDQGTEACLTACSDLLAAAPGADDAEVVVSGIERALQGRHLPTLPPTLIERIDTLWHTERPGLTIMRLELRLGRSRAYDQACQQIADPAAPVDNRLALIEVLGQTANAASIPVLLHLLEDSQPTVIRLAALSALQMFPDPSIATTVLRLYPTLPAEMRPRAQAFLCGRLESARLFLKSVDAGRIPAREVSPDQLHRLLLHQDAKLTALITRHWGQLGPETTGQKQARIRSIQLILVRGKGNPVDGRRLFQHHCASCHTLFGEGARIGPDLTGADRKDTAFLVTSIVDPSAVIRKEYIAYVALTNTGRVLTGLMAESSASTVTLLESTNARTVLLRSDLEELRPSPQSLMPERILDKLDDQQLCDLFSYLQADAPKPSTPLPTAPQEEKRPPLKVCLVSGSLEYQSDDSLAQFQKYLETHYGVQCTRAFRKADDDLPGLENLETCDVMVLFTRRLTISGEQLDRVKKYCRSGKPIVAIRTASHGFQNWLALDREVLGGNYQGHYGPNSAPEVEVIEKATKHPVLAGVTPFRATGSLYKNPGLAADVTVLLGGRIAEHTEPVAWVRLHNGGRVFCTSLGHPSDFKQNAFLRLLSNAIFWTAKRTPVELPPASPK